MSDIAEARASTKQLLTEIVGRVSGTTGSAQSDFICAAGLVRDLAGADGAEDFLSLAMTAAGSAF